MAFFMGDLLSSVPVLLVLRLAAGQGSHVAALNLVSRDGGTSSAMFAAIAAATYGLPRGSETARRWRYGAICALSIFLLTLVLWRHRLFDVQHMAAAAIGFLCCGVPARRRMARHWGRSEIQATHG